MNRATRLAVTVVTVEIVLAGLWAWLVMIGHRYPAQAGADYFTTVGTILGGAMGALPVLALVLWFAFRRRAA
jgi:uncharacterized protein (TIGR03382 family)